MLGCFFSVFARDLKINVHVSPAYAQKFGNNFGTHLDHVFQHANDILKPTGVRLLKTGVYFKHRGAAHDFGDLNYEEEGFWVCNQPCQQKADLHLILMPASDALENVISSAKVNQVVFVVLRESYLGKYFEESYDVDLSFTPISGLLAHEVLHKFKVLHAKSGLMFTRYDRQKIEAKLKIDMQYSDLTKKNMPRIGYDVPIDKSSVKLVTQLADRYDVNQDLLSQPWAVPIVFNYYCENGKNGVGQEFEVMRKIYATQLLKRTAKALKNKKAPQMLKSERFGDFKKWVQFPFESRSPFEEETQRTIETIPFFKFFSPTTQVFLRSELNALAQTDETVSLMKDAVLKLLN